LKKLHRALVVTLSSLGLAAAFAATAAPAQAAETQNPVDITRYSAPDLVVASPACRDVKVTASATVQKGLYWVASVDVHRGAQPLRDLQVGTDAAAGLVRICPGVVGLGRVDLGGALVGAEDPGADEYADMLLYKDATRGSFTVRGQAKATLTARRSGRTVTLTARTTRYTPANRGYRPLNVTAHVQVKRGHTWSNLKTVSTKNGTATVRITQRVTQSYRLTFAKTCTATAATSATVRK